MWIFIATATIKLSFLIYFLTRRFLAQIMCNLTVHFTGSNENVGRQVGVGKRMNENAHDESRGKMPRILIGSKISR
jgi:hypothetical protein